MSGIREYALLVLITLGALQASPAAAQDTTAPAAQPPVEEQQEQRPSYLDQLPDATTLLSIPPPGTIWSQRSARTMLGQDGNTREVGDLVTVNIYEATSASLAADTETSRKSTVGAKIAALFGIETSILNANPNMGPEISMSTESDSSFSGSGTTTRQSSLQGQLTCEVVEVLETGNLRIYGQKEVRSNRETQYLVLEGIVRPKDIRADNTVDSYLLAQARIENTGSGVLSDKQGPGIGQRVVDRVWPF
jgi:flagellar L-ring protein precursor FlgH